MSYCGVLVRYLEEIACLIVVFWLDKCRRYHIFLCCFGKIFVGEIMSYCVALYIMFFFLSCSVFVQSNVYTF